MMGWGRTVVDSGMAASSSYVYALSYSFPERTLYFFTHPPFFYLLSLRTVSASSRLM